ncbi:MAG: DoxX family membrane protein [Candidatus Omnitrophica bacterium]|nr:DoxX family membrane protein [Candidatus Omnitrophota bacterium]
MPLKSNLFILLRLLVGTLLIVSGLEKLVSPYQNFLYVIQNYALLPPLLEELGARAWPWAEFFLGVFLVLGFWLRWVLRGVMATFAVFIFVVAQALVRHLPVNECGCFGDLISFPLPVVITFDTALLAVTGVLYYRLRETIRFSLDQYFNDNART